MRANIKVTTMVSYFTENDKHLNKEKLKCCPPSYIVYKTLKIPIPISDMSDRIIRKFSSVGKLS